MVDINKMARAAGIGSAVGAVGGIIKASNDSEPDTSSNILGGIVGGAIVGSIGGAGISAGRQALNAKKLTSNASNQVVENATKISAKNGVPNNVNDLNVAKQISKATAGDTAPILSGPRYGNIITDELTPANYNIQQKTFKNKTELKNFMTQNKGSSLENLYFDENKKFFADKNSPYTYTQYFDKNDNLKYSYFSKEKLDPNTFIPNIERV